MKNSNYKKLLIIGISIIVFLSILFTLILFSTFTNGTVETSSDNKANNIEQIIPNVTKENTTFKISDIENKVKNVNISATNKLSDYNLYYYKENTTNNVDNIINTQLLILLQIILSLKTLLPLTIQVILLQIIAQLRIIIQQLPII